MQSALSATAMSVVDNRSPTPPPRRLGDTNFIHQALNPGKDEIRLLRILPNQYSQDIQCHITHVSLDAPPHFNAISYAWGDPEDTCLITLDGLEFPVTRSLWGALRALRSTTTEVLVWADAVCINQSDTAERGLQVQKMTKIYQKTFRMAIWLGPREDDSNKAFALLEEIATLRNSEKSLRRIVTNPVRKRQFGAVVDLFQRAYWDRLWCVQEVWNAKNINIYCGSCCASWEVVSKAQQYFYDNVSL